MPVITSDVEVCTSTGYALIPSGGRKIWRIAKTSYGPLNPEQRSLEAAEHKDWGRYDVPGHRTAYGAEPKQAAYAESLAFARPSKELDRPLDEHFDGGDAGSLRDAIGRDFEERGHLSIGRLAAGWRLERLEHQVTLPHQGWFVDIEHSRSVAALNGALTRELETRCIERLTVSHLRSEDRELTASVAALIHQSTLHDGSRPHGIRYGSKHGSDWTCWAIWLRRIDATAPSDLTTADEGAEILGCSHNPELLEVAERFGMYCF